MFLSNRTYIWCMQSVLCSCVLWKWHQLTVGVGQGWWLSRITIDKSSALHLQAEATRPSLGKGEIGSTRYLQTPLSLKLSESEWHISAFLRCFLRCVFSPLRRPWHPPIMRQSTQGPAVRQSIWKGDVFHIEIQNKNSCDLVSWWPGMKCHPSVWSTCPHQSGRDEKSILKQ